MPGALEPVALLVVRLWAEPDAERPALRVRLTAVEDLLDREAPVDSTVVHDLDEAVAYVRDWLAERAAAARDQDR